MTGTQQDSGDTIKAVAAAAVTVLLWASAFVAIRYVGRDFSAGPLTLGRLSAALVVLGLLLAVQRGRGLPILPKRPIARKDILLVVVCGVAWFGIYNLALNAAEHVLDAGTTAMIVNVGPLLIALTAGLLLGEGFPRPLLFGMAIAFAGAVVIGFATSGQAAVPLRGVLLALLAAVTYAIGVVAQKPVLARIPVLTVTTAAAAIGALLCLPFLPRLIEEWSRAGTGSILGLIYLGVFPTAIAFTTWGYALARMPAGRLGATTYVVPPLTILLGWILLGEAPVWLACVGGAICLVGVAVSRLRPRAAPRSS